MPTRAELIVAIDALVAEQRSRCMWFVRPDWRPRTDDERRYALVEIRRHGDAGAYRRASELDAWLSQSSSGASAA